jgi:hypothetical protein
MQIVTGLLTWLAIAPTVPVQRPAVPACADDPAFHQLDFWLGSWLVTSGGQQVGTNRIESVLSGCAITESWRAADGSEGRSLFYYLPSAKQWRQVWVTAAATVPGGVKEKRLVATLPDGALRFQGEIGLPDGRSFLDRTTLTPLTDGRVRQLIEVSRDGTAWKATFDAIYTRQAGAGSPPG